VHLTMQQFASVAPAGRPFYPALAEAAASWGIDTALEESIWLGQLYVESDAFTSLRESLNYLASVLPGKFKGRITEAEAAQYGRIEKIVNGRKVVTQPANQPAIANCIYGRSWGRKNLGNTLIGDGWAFIGRGFPHITGRDNYRTCSIGIYRDERLVDAPHLLEQPEAAALSAGWFWRSRSMSPLAAKGDIKAVTMKWTGWKGEGDGAGVKLAERVAHANRFRDALDD